jgi:protein-S-isoprenylcysteine O-methyltransferase Ste14
MKHIFHFTKRLFQNIFWAILMLAVVYAFLALCNWDFNPNGWNVFSHFLAATGELIVAVTTWDAMSNTVRTILARKKRESKQ